MSWTDSGEPASQQLAEAGLQQQPPRAQEEILHWDLRLHCSPLKGPALRDGPPSPGPLNPGCLQRTCCTRLPMPGGCSVLPVNIINLLSKLQVSWLAKALDDTLGEHSWAALTKEMFNNGSVICSHRLLFLSPFPVFCTDNRKAAITVLDAYFPSFCVTVPAVLPRTRVVY